MPRIEITRRDVLDLGGIRNVRRQCSEELVLGIDHALVHGVVLISSEPVSHEALVLVGERPDTLDHGIILHTVLHVLVHVDTVN